MDPSLRELYQEVILDHSRHPRHFGVLDNATHKAEGHNPLCGDRVTVMLVLDESGRVADIKFQGKGCAISQASASMMTELLAGRTKEEAEKLMAGFLHLVKGEEAKDLSVLELSTPAKATAWICIAGMFWIGLFPNTVLNLATEATNVLK